MSNISADDGMESQPMGTRIGIVGAGLIGRAWAIVFARAGFQVAIYDSVPDALAQCRTLLKQSIDDLARDQLIDELPGALMARIAPVTTLAEALKDAVLVQENVRETVEAKQEIFAEMDRLAAPHTLLASSTSSIPASAFSADLHGRARVMVAHPVNPPYLVPLVELGPAPWTSEEAVARAYAIFSQAGQTPVVLRKEITGFLLNRIQGAVLNEALNLYAGGYASVEDLDKVVKNGLGLRWSFMGPFETIDLNAPAGVVDYAARYAPMYREVCRTQFANTWNADLLSRIEAERREILSTERLGERARWRDRRLIALLRHKREQPL
jgi:L-gulonate 3-dehydrogenase